MSANVLGSANWWFTFVSSFFFCIGGVWAIVRFIHNYLEKSVEEKLSLRLSYDENNVNAELDRIEQKLERHLGYHEGKKE